MWARHLLMFLNLPRKAHYTCHTCAIKKFKILTHTKYRLHFCIGTNVKLSCKQKRIILIYLSEGRPVLDKVMVQPIKVICLWYFGLGKIYPRPFNLWIRFTYSVCAGWLIAAINLRVHICPIILDHSIKEVKTLGSAVRSLEILLETWQSLEWSRHLTCPHQD